MVVAERAVIAESSFADFGVQPETVLEFPIREERTVEFGKRLGETLGFSFFDSNFFRPDFATGEDIFSRSKRVAQSIASSWSKAHYQPDFDILQSGLVDFGVQSARSLSKTQPERTDEYQNGMYQVIRAIQSEVSGFRRREDGIVLLRMYQEELKREPAQTQNPNRYQLDFFSLIDTA